MPNLKGGTQMGLSVPATNWAIEMVTCPECGDSVRVPNIPVRNTGRLICSAEHLFTYRRAQRQAIRQSMRGLEA